MSIFYESTLSDSYIYSMLNVDKSTTQKISNAIKTGTQIDASYIQEQILQIKRTHISPLVDNVLNAFNKGDIILIYSKVVVSKAFPFVVIKAGGKNKVYVFTENYGSLSKNEMVDGGTMLDIPMKDLYVLMESAYLAWLYYDYPAKFQRSLGLMKLTNNLYTSMFMRILNKEYALSMDQDLFNNVNFVISRYYLEKVWEMSSHELIFNYAAMSCENLLSKSSLTIVDDNYSSSNIESLDDMITFLSKLNPRMESLNTRYFVDSFIRMYKAPAILSMDTFPYFLFTLVCAYCGSFLINQPIINDIIRNSKGANLFYNELSKLT